MSDRLGIKQRIKQFVFPSSRPLQPFGSIWMNFPQMQTIWMNADSESFADKGYGGNVYVFAAIRAITSRCKGVPWRVYRITNEKAFKQYRAAERRSKTFTDDELLTRKDEALEADDSHELNEILYKPNHLMTWEEFIEATIAFKHIMGNVFELGIRLDTGPNAGRITSMIPMTPSVVKIYAPEYPAPITHYEIKRNVVKPEDVLHLRYFNAKMTSTRIGLAPIEVVLKQITQSNSYLEWNTSLVQNMARIPGILQLKVKKLTKEMKSQIAETFSQDVAGERNAGKPLITEQDFEWQDIGFKPHDIDWIEGFKLGSQQIAMAFEIPPELLGDSEHKTYNSVPEAVRYFYFGKIIPEMQELRGGLNSWLVPGYETKPNELWLDFDLNGIEALREERNSIFKRATDGLAAGLFTINQALKMIDMSEIGEAGDVRFLPMGAQPVSDDEILNGADSSQQQLRAALDLLKKHGIEQE